MTHLWVGVTERAVVKLRATYPVAQDDDFAPFLIAFIEELAQGFKLGGRVGMADYDHHAALTQPVPAGLPEAF